MVQITESSKQKGAHFAFSATTFATTKVQSSIFPPTRAYPHARRPPPSAPSRRDTCTSHRVGHVGIPRCTRRVDRRGDYRRCFAGASNALLPVGAAHNDISRHEVNRPNDSILGLVTALAAQLEGTAEVVLLFGGAIEDVSLADDHDAT